MVSAGEDARLSTLDQQTSLARVLTTYCFGFNNKKPRSREQGF
jgi:hypothetical protein